MSPRFRYLRLTTALLPAGLFGLSAALAPTAAEARATDGAPSAGPDVTTDTTRISEQLQGIRDAVTSAVAEGHVQSIEDGDVRLAWWLNGNGRGWGNGGREWGNGGHPAWGNGAVPWHNGWGNGWGNGGWHNWGNGGWHNWRN